MAIREICFYPDPVLREECEEVTEIDSEVIRLLDDMAETMYDAEGIGLAAPQVGVPKRITIVDVSREQRGLIELINPTILSSEGDVESEEGCLSIPEFRDTIRRSERITVEALNRQGEAFQLEAEELLAICIQHEIDHLDGVLFIDHLSRLKRDMFKRWHKKQQRLADE